MRRQQRVELRCGRRLFATVGLAQAQQPGFGQVGAALRKPQLAFDQGDHRQIENRRHVPDVHQPLGFGKLGEGFGESPFAAIQRSDHAMADQHADVTAGAGLDQPGTQAATPGLRLQPCRQ
ncbi:hypothetical protein D3C85_1514040 [compost metagenome]